MRGFARGSIAAVAGCSIVACLGINASSVWAVTDTPVLTGPDNDFRAVASQKYFAWNEVPGGGPGQADVFVRESGAPDPPTRVNALHQDSGLGGISGHRLVFSQGEDIYVYNLRMGERRPVSAINTNKYEFSPTISGHRILFARQTPENPLVKVRLYNLRTGSIGMIAPGFPGQIAGHFVVYTRCDLSACEIHRLNLHTDDERVITSPQSWYYGTAALTRDGAAYFGAWSSGDPDDCGHGGGPLPGTGAVMRLQHGVTEITDAPLSFFSPYALETSTGVEVFYARFEPGEGDMYCDYQSSDVYKLTDPDA